LFRSTLETLPYSIYINEKGKKSLDAEYTKQNDPQASPQHKYLDDDTPSLTSPIYRKSKSAIKLEPLSENVKVVPPSESDLTDTGEYEW
jgi:hypothetical protein